MKRLIFSLLLLLSTIVGVNAQLLYKITGNGLEKPSYIIGTYHLAPATFVDSIPGANEALAAVEQVCGELDMRDAESPDNKRKLQAAMFLPSGQKLKDVLTADEWDKLNTYMQGVIGTDLNNPLLSMQMGKMNPFAIMTQLQLVQYMKLTPGFNPLELIDNYFQTKATRAGKSVIGFETVDFQIEVLYGMDLERQKKQLFCMIDNSEYSLEMMKSLTDAYFSQDMAAVLAVSEEKEGNDCDSTPEEDDALIYNRNSDWAEKIPAIVACKSTLFVVGAAHLPGERGVLELLRVKGYTIEGVQ